MKKTLHHTLLLLTMMWSVVLLPEHALAQTASLTCNNDKVASGQLFDDRPHQQDSACQFDPNLKHIFSTVMCNFVQLLNSVLDSVYCGMQSLLKDMVGAVLTLYVAVFGIQMLMGVANATAGEFLNRIIKIALVWVFVSESTVGIQTVFNFFISLAGNGVEWVMSTVPSPFDPSNVPVDCYDPQALSITGFMAAFTRLDVVICEAVTGPLVLADSKIVGFFVVLCLLAPQIGMLIVSWLWLNLKVLVQGMVTFLLGVAAIAFLIAMAPIFLSFMLFKATAGFFENWLKYMMSFSLQVIVVFACIALWLTITVYFLTFFSDLSKTIFPYNTVHTEGQLENLNSSWGVCPFNYFSDSSKAVPPAPPNTPSGPYVTCKDANVNPDSVIPISGLLWNDTKKELGCSIDPDASGVGKSNDCTRYLTYVIYHLITLIVISFAFEALLREAPRIAVYLAGPDYTPPLATGGFGITRAGQVRSLFSSSGSAEKQKAQSSDSGFSLKNLLFGKSDNAASAAESENSEVRDRSLTEKIRDRASTLSSNRR